MILSLQGCMAVGKTTAVRYLQEHAPYIHVSAEDTRAVIEEVRRRKLDKNCYPDYLEIQKLWLQNEVTRYQKAVRYPCSVMDFGAEEIEFYTLNYPKSIGADWEVENALKPELEAVRACLPDRILFLDASEEVLRQHKEQDTTRSRMFFEQYLTTLLPLKRQWFAGRENVDVLSVDGLSAQQVGEKVRKWCDECIRNGAHAAGALDVKLTEEDMASLEKCCLPHPIVGAINANPPQGVVLLDEKK